MDCTVNDDRELGGVGGILTILFLPAAFQPVKSNALDKPTCPMNRFD
ncbi:MAG: hypothetical protein RL341_2324 [Pseudomonadota bacterium]